MSTHSTPSSSTLLLKATSIYWAGASLLHGYLTIHRLNPFFGSSKAFEAFVFKTISLKLSGYVLINGILAWRWADKGVADRYDQAVMAVLVCMNSIAGIAFLRKGGLKPPPTMLLLGTSAMTVASQMV